MLLTTVPYSLFPSQNVENIGGSGAWRNKAYICSYLTKDLLFPSRWRLLCDHLQLPCGCDLLLWLVCKFPWRRVMRPLECPVWCCSGGGLGNAGALEPCSDLLGRVGSGRKGQPGVSSQWAGLALAWLEASLERNFPVMSSLCLPCVGNIALEDGLSFALLQKPAAQEGRDDLGCLHFVGGGSTFS